MRILFCNIGWMENYRGLTARDHIRGGGEYVDETKMGGEVCNFLPIKSQMYGYVTRRDNGFINIDRLGASPDDDSISGVTVVWVARRKKVGSVVVGWYRNATVYRQPQWLRGRTSMHRRSKVDVFLMQCKEKDATLLPEDARTFPIPRGRVPGSFGQTNFWYADSTLGKQTIARFRQYLKRGGIPQSKGRAVGRSASDADHRSRVEQAAIDFVSRHFEKQGYDVKTVEKENLGWDLEASIGKLRLRVEVKGLSGSGTTAELTPNEYRAFLECDASYRLAVVNHALNNASMLLCRYSKAERRWIVVGYPKRHLKVREATSASIVL